MNIGMVLVFFFMFALPVGIAVGSIILMWLIPERMFTGRKNDD